MDTMITVHLTDIEIAAMADGTRSNRTVPQLQAHLAQCDECRGLLVDVTRLADLASEAPRETRGFSLRMAGLAAAAVFAISLPLLYPAMSVPTREVASERTGAVERQSIRTLMPGGVVNDSHRLRFAWSGEQDASYRLTLTDATGGPVWLTTTTETSTILPDSIHLDVGARYYWYVDALHLDGSSVTSGRREFTTGPP